MSFVHVQIDGLSTEVSAVERAMIRGDIEGFFAGELFPLPVGCTVVMSHDPSLLNFPFSTLTVIVTLTRGIGVEIMTIAKGISRAIRRRVPRCSIRHCFVCVETDDVVWSHSVEAMEETETTAGSSDG
ncbi:MAG: hypothetical protein V1778_01730 [bacterium]